ncbi:prolactin-5A1-like [Peromyscus eremicus]|uniref:prolactin-5A1-like n=1 Tax=Peromyscus eremicus TaxID=42410 RepID=UPI0027DAF456|nr:prolactin-5A1-like [Peromyscus eremicus]
MRLSLTQPSSWALLLPLLSSMLLWENVASLPMCEVINGHCQLTLEYLFNQARGLAEDINHLTLEIFNEFNKEYYSGPRVLDKIPLHLLCHNYSFPFPDNTTEGQEIQPEVLLKVTIGMLVGWNNTLSHVIIDLVDLESIPGVGAFISKIRKIVEDFTKLTTLLKDVKSLLNLVRLEFEEDEDYPASAGLPSSHLLNNSSRLLFYHILFGCLKYNAEKVVTHVNILRCQMLHKKC